MSVDIFHFEILCVALARGQFVGPGSDFITALRKSVKDCAIPLEEGINQPTARYMRKAILINQPTARYMRKAILIHG